MKPVNIKKFVQGILDGFFSMSFIDDFENCFDNVLNLGDDIDEVVESFQKEEYFEGLIQVKEAFDDLQDALKYCSEGL